MGNTSNAQNLKHVWIISREKQLIYNLYQNQKAIINVRDEQREAKIKKLVIQWCTLTHDF